MGAPTPDLPVLREVPLTRSTSGIVQTTIEIKTWMRQLPVVDAVRPGRCPRCQMPSRRPGRPLGMHGHGVVKRDVWGPPSLGAVPKFGEVLLRRYRCLACAAVVRVGPRGLFGRYRYGAGAIGLALALWAVFDQAPETIRETVSPWRKVAVETKRRWPSLRRWTRAAREQRLWRVVRGVGEHTPDREAVGTILRALVAGLPGSTFGALQLADVFTAARYSGGTS